MKILITNNALANRGGSELYVRDVATELLKRGHTPIVYSTQLGSVATELRAATVPVVDNLHDVAVVPDVIHGQHHLDTMTALLHFANTPAVQFCHSWALWYEKPIHFPRILRYVAVDYTCRDRLLYQQGIPESKITIIHNFVDLDRFRPRSNPLPARPEAALVFSNHAREDSHLPAVRAACAREGIRLAVMGNSSGTSSATPEKILGAYDIVFAKGKCALESMAVGSAVILCDAEGLGTIVNVEGVDRLRKLNFGIRTLQHPISVERLVREIKRYDAKDATEVSKLIRTVAGHERVVDELLGLYEDVIEEHSALKSAGHGAEGRAAAAYLRQLKIDFASHGAASMRLRERLERWPLIGKIGVKLARRITGHPKR